MIGARHALLVVSLVPLGIAACSAARRDAFGDDRRIDEAGASEPPVGAFDGGIVDAPGPDAEIVLYAHTNTTLYRMRGDVPSATSTRVGDFDCVKGNAVITDIAVDRAGRLSGVSQTAVYPEMMIDGASVRCGASVTLSKKGAFYGAAYAPAGPLHPTQETLVVAGTEGVLYAVDPTGDLTAVGHFGDVPSDDGNGHDYRASTVGKRWELSGDVVFLENAGKAVGFATVRDCPSPPSIDGCNRTDTLVEIDPSLLSRTTVVSVTKAVRGQVVRSAGCADGANASYGSIYGIASVLGDVIGFARARPEAGAAERALVVRIANADGTACLLDDATPSVGSGWAGGGVTTLAPVTAPPPK